MLKELHDREWVGDRSVWPTFNKIKERYWWPRFYNEIKRYGGIVDGGRSEQVLDTR